MTGFLQIAALVAFVFFVVMIIINHINKKRG